MKPQDSDKLTPAASTLDPAGHATHELAACSSLLPLRTEFLLIKKLYLNASVDAMLMLFTLNDTKKEALPLITIPAQ